MTAPDLTTFPPGPADPADEQLAEFTADPFGYIERMSREHGTMFTLNLGTLGNGERAGVHGNGRWVFLTRPQQVRAMHEAPAVAISGGQANRVFFGSDDDSVGYIDGAEHRCRRTRLQPGLSGGRDHTPIVERVAVRRSAGWPIGEPFPLFSELQQLTAELIVEIVCGSLDRADRDRLAAALPRTENADLESTAATTAEQEIKSLVHERLAGHLDRCAGTDDLMAELLRPAADGSELAVTAVCDEVFSLLYTGFSTTANTLSWVFLELLADARVLREVRAELAARFRPGMGQREATAAFPYLDAVVKEALRLHPVSALNGVRMVTEALRIDGRYVPAGTVLVHCAHLIQRSVEDFDEPERFRPERFLDGSVDPHAFGAFGGGSRMCVGRVFALREMRTILATVLSRLRLETTGDIPRARQEGIFMAPADRARCVVTGWLERP